MDTSTLPLYVLILAFTESETDTNFAPFGSQLLTLSVNGLKSRRLLPFFTSFLVGVSLPVDLLEKKDIVGFVRLQIPT